MMHFQDGRPPGAVDGFYTARIVKVCVFDKLFISFLLLVLLCLAPVHPALLHMTRRLRSRGLSKLGEFIYWISDILI